MNVAFSPLESVRLFLSLVTLIFPSWGKAEVVADRSFVPMVQFGARCGWAVLQLGLPREYLEAMFGQCKQVIWSPEQAIETAGYLLGLLRNQ